MDKESLKEKFNNKEIFDKMVEATFKNADLNKNSFIERNELSILLKSVYGTLGLNHPEEKVIDDEFKRLDKNKDNKISQEEFKVLVKDLAMFSIENM